MQEQEQEQKLRAEILEDARRKASRLVQRAERDAEKALDAARQRLAQQRLERLAKAEQEAAERERAIRAGIRHELRAEWLRRREQEIEAVLRRAVEMLENAEGDARRESFAQLLRQATAAVDAPEARVRIRPEDRSLLEESGAGLAVEPDADLAVGLVVSSADAGRSIDNTYRARLRRLRRLILDELRAALGAEGRDLALPEWTAES